MNVLKNLVIDKFNPEGSPLISLNAYIPDNCKNISRRAFTGCSSLETVSLPKGIHLGKDVFTHCNPDLKIIYR